MHIKDKALKFRKIERWKITMWKNYANFRFFFYRLRLSTTSLAQPFQERVRQSVSIAYLCAIT